MCIVDLPLDRAPRRPDITRSVCRGAARHLRERGFATITEMTFANGRRGDIVALSPSGDLLVVEVKSGIDRIIAIIAMPFASPWRRSSRPRSCPRMSA